MFDVKKIIIGAAAGFLMSFVIGLFSSVAFGIVILRAFIFCVVGAVVGFGCGFAFERFLSQPGAEVQGSESSGGEGGSSHSKKTTGGIVDITVDEGSLENDANGPKFVVTNAEKFAPPKIETSESTAKSASGGIANAVAPEKVSPAPEKAVETAAPVSEAAPPVQEAPAQNAAPKVDEGVSDYVAPVAAAGEQKVDDSAGFQPVNLADSAPKVEADAPMISAASGLDVLPDIGEITLGSNKNGNSDIISDSEFASDGRTERETVAFPNGTSAAETNTNEMAMAIRTLLAKD